MKPFAIYFPQFYPIPTNDAAWGLGFTDWSLIAGANMRDDWQRRAPARGYYDGASPAVHREHIAEAARTGLGGFAVYHYWFYTHQELAAFEQTLLDPAPGGVELPWFLIWANEGWTRRWVGDPGVLVELSRRPAADAIERHCDHLQRCFERPAYFRMDGRPLFAWYNLGHFEEPAQVVEQYRAALRRRGCEPTFAHFVKNPFDALYAPLVEATYLFEPRLFFTSGRRGRGAGAKRAFDFVAKLLGSAASTRLLLWFDRLQRHGTVHTAEQFAAWLDSAQRAEFKHALPGRVQEVVSPGWNNAPRYGTRYTCLQDVPPAQFGKRLREAAREPALPALINAWNEWSEGAAIEPCAYLGSRYADAVRALDGEAS